MCVCVCVCVCVCGRWVLSVKICVRSVQKAVLIHGGDLNVAATAKLCDSALPELKRVTITSTPTSAAFPFCPRVVVFYFRRGTVVVVVVSSLLSVDSTEIGNAACV